MMVKIPNITPKNKQCDGIVNLIDMYPTLLDLCGLPQNLDNDGKSFAELIYNPDMEWSTPTLTDYNYGGHRIYDGRYSYIVFIEQGIEELYDHQADPMEWRNLAQDQAYSNIKDRLKVLVPTQREPVALRD